MWHAICQSENIVRLSGTHTMHNKRCRVLTRRSFVKIVAFAPFALSLDAREADSQTVEIRDLLMGTFVQMKGIGVKKDVLADTISHMKELERIFSRHDEGSPLSELNHKGSLKNPPRELMTVLHSAREAYSETMGTFDVTVLPVLLHFEKLRKPLTPKEQERFREIVGFDKVESGGTDVRLRKPGMKLTLDGIAKGYIIDRGVERLRERGSAGVLVNVGGDVYCGKSTHGWSVGIYDPRHDRLSRKLSLESAAVCTSGNYVNYFSPDKKLHHIIDPASLSSPTRLASTTVVARSTMRADILSTAMFIKGPEGTTLLREGEKAYLITSDGREVILG